MQLYINNIIIQIPNRRYLPIGDGKNLLMKYEVKNNFNNCLSEAP